ncbi:MAG TPA: type II toxin-antitoxin system RelE/ParE family toxin [Candidatus Saccharimonadales bacterium]|jgi:plasmid stabilization system protein ParE
MARLKWLPEALTDFYRLYQFLKDKDEKAAKNAADKILVGTNLLKISPRIGKPLPDETNRRELYVAFGASAYVILYLLEGSDTVVIVRVWHSKENRF